MDTTADPGALRSGEPPCVVCELRRDDGSLIPHRHANGRAALTGCRRCVDGEHSRCDGETYFCTCQHPVCREPMT